ncbi:unnamed protein product [Mytilus edulis]|uniref:Uncharacterized protein n=1 Tax=Mytilus edulis TaxID=6550 RepID=A0A8S3V1Q6_MYTED|nr:unnamed protein product [Mytilus edulis]
MSESQCAALFVTFSDRCCEITYINSSKECKLDSSGCCHTDFDNFSGSSILHTSRKFVDRRTTRAEKTELNAMEMINMEVEAVNVVAIRQVLVSRFGESGQWKQFVQSSRAVRCNLINKDCTGTNYIRFKCRYFKDEYFDFELSVSPRIVTSGSYGERSDVCSANSAIRGVKTTIVAIQVEYFDDAALNDVQFFCCE